MNWVAPSEKDTATETPEKRLWAAADRFRAISSISFLRFAEVRFAHGAKLVKSGTPSPRDSRLNEPAVCHASNISYLAPNAWFDFLLGLVKNVVRRIAFNYAFQDKGQQDFH